MQFNMYEIIERKKLGKELAPEEIKWVINGLMDKSIPDYQMSAFLMAIYFMDMTPAETAALTDAMLYSGKTLSFEGQNVIDKHSTGGVGDKTSFILAPIAAACGIKVPMIAGRGLGFTGGTVDKVESIPGFNTDIPFEKFHTLVEQRGLVLIGQTEDIAPADKIIYALRDVTATIDSIPLITASIMSKKLAEGANGIVMDVKVGSGAFMKTKAQAKKLAKSILRTADRFNKSSRILLTNMDQPNGNAVGNTLEIIECIDVLKGNGPKDITELSLTLAAHMIHIGDVESTYPKALKRAKLAIKDGSALKKLEELIKFQGGNAEVINDYTLLPLAECKTEIPSKVSGYIKSFQTDQIGFLLTDLDGGRKLKGDILDLGTGFILNKKIGDKVKKDESLLTIFHRKDQAETVKEIINKFQTSVIKISKTKVAKPELIYELLGN